MVNCLDNWSDYKRVIFENSDKILIGRCCIASEVEIEEILGIKI